jgi:hypothetical protein
MAIFKGNGSYLALEVAATEAKPAYAGFKPLMRALVRIGGRKFV